MPVIFHRKKRTKNFLSKEILYKMLLKFEDYEELYIFPPQNDMMGQLEDHGVVKVIEMIAHTSLD